MKRKERKIINGILIAILLVFVVLLASGEYFMYYALHHERTPLDEEVAFKAHGKTYPNIAPWMDSIRTTKELKDTFIVNDKGIRLHAYYLPAPTETNNTAVIVHGYKSNAIEMMHIGYLYNQDLGWNILLPNLSAHGKSEGEDINMGWYDRLDVLKWIEIVHNTFESDTIVVHGISMGAATTMCVAGEETPDYVRGFVDDCGYTSVWDEFSGELYNQFGLPSFPLLHFTSLLCKVQKGWSYSEASPLRQVAKCDKPMLFIHGGSDTYVPTAMVYPLFEAKKDKKELWIAEGSEHAVSYLDHPKEYTEKVKKFVESLH